MHSRYNTSYRPTLMLGGFIATLTGLLSFEEIAELVNIGVLNAFIIICIVVMFLRLRQLNLPHSFHLPLLWFVALMGVLFSLFLIIGWPWIVDRRSKYLAFSNLDGNWVISLS